MTDTAGRSVVGRRHVPDRGDPALRPEWDGPPRHATVLATDRTAGRATTKDRSPIAIATTAVAA
jgi:hypothetical protein